MNRKTFILTLAIAATLVSTPVLAGDHGHHGRHADGPGRFDHGVERARVIDAVPIRVIDRVPVSHRECREEVVWQRARDTGVSPGEGMIAGTLIGGVIGNQAVHGRSRGAATVAGTLIGAVVGHAMASDHDGRSHRRVEPRCETHHGYREEERIVGYDVTYRYAGRIYTTRMDHDPGKWLPVTVQPY